MICIGYATVRVSRHAFRIQTIWLGITPSVPEKGPNNGWFTFGNATGTALFIGTNCCGLWQFLPWSLPAGMTGLTTGYFRNDLESFQGVLNGTSPGDQIGSLSTPNTVITSLSILAANDVFALSWIQSAQSSGFDMAQHTVALSDFQAATTQEGEQGRVITAVSYNGSDVFYLSYGWQGDTSSVYETQVATATIDTVTSVITNLAGQGYIITAIEGQDTVDGSGVLVVGTRVKGDTMPRPIMVSPPEDSAFNALTGQGYAMVAVANNTAESGALVFKNFIGER